MIILLDLSAMEKSAAGSMVGELQLQGFEIDHEASEDEDRMALASPNEMTPAVKNTIEQIITKYKGTVIDMQ